MNEALVKKLKLSGRGRVAVIEPPEGYLQQIGQSEAQTAFQPDSDAEYS